MILACLKTFAIPSTYRAGESRLRRRDQSLLSSLPNRATYLLPFVTRSNDLESFELQALNDVCSPNA